MIAVALQVVEEMMHHLVSSFGPNRHLMCAYIAELLERSKELGNQPQAYDDTSVVGNVRQTRFDELFSDELLGVEAEQRAERLLCLERQSLAEESLKKFHTI